ncbi:hypothetical protein U0070_025570 [Myodes glareolus]|uniref:Uncharacterized protein n=1 Tax=Myodes glareolus TaxID=447135 RepID=A0AAW0HTL8_MYOGA
MFFESDNFFGAYDEQLGMHLSSQTADKKSLSSLAVQKERQLLHKLCAAVVRSMVEARPFLISIFNSIGTLNGQPTVFAAARRLCHDPLDRVRAGRVPRIDYKAMNASSHYKTGKEIECYLLAIHKVADHHGPSGGYSGPSRKAESQCNLRASLSDSNRYIRNGDFISTQLLAQHSALILPLELKGPSNFENNMGLITLANDCEVLTTLIPDTGHIRSKLHTGKITFCMGIRVVHLALKHWQGKIHKIHVIALPNASRKKKVNEVINSGKEEVNTQKLTVFVSTLNSKDKTGSHQPTVPPGPSLTDALIASPILATEGSTILGLSAIDFGSAVDPSVDLELALVRRCRCQLSHGLIGASQKDDYDVMQDPEFLQGVLENFPGVHPNNEAVRNAMGSVGS